MRLFKKKPLPTPRSCPFCGGTAKLTKCGDQKEFWVVLCTECHETPVDWDEAKVNSVKAIEIYNERADFASRIIRIHHYVEASMTKFTSSEGK
jgi:transcription elongation factor Elf1